MPGTINVLNRAVSLDTAPKFEAFTGVRLWYDDDQFFFAGDETGRVLEADNPWATQEMVDNILASISGYVYQPFEAASATLDPVAELGDGVNVGGVYAPLAAITTRFDSMCVADISAPADEEIDHEYPYLSPAQREFQRTKAQTYSLIEKSSKEILLEVGKIQDDLKNYSTIKQTAESIEMAVSGLIGESDAQTLIDQSLESITLSVSNSGNTSTLTLKSGETVLSSQRIVISGFVTFQGLSGGTTTIDGACIKTGTIDAEKINLSGVLQTIDSTGKETGYLGAANGLDPQGNTTNGVIIANAWDYDGNVSGDNYVIVTNGGVRLQAGSNRIVVTNQSINLTTDKGKAYYNGVEIGSGGDDATVIPVWG